MLACVFTPKIGYAIKPNSTVTSKFEEAIKQEMVLDVANAVSSLRLEVAFPGIGRILAMNRTRELVETEARGYGHAIPGLYYAAKGWTQRTANQ